MAWVSTCTFASSQATTSPFIQMRSAVGTDSLPLQVREDRPSGVLCGGVAAEVRSPKAGVECPVDGGFYCRCLLLHVKSVPEHHGDGPEHRQRIGLARARDVGRRAVDGL